MKNFFNLFLTATVMCAAVSMTSCSKDDDDDPIVKDDVVEVSIFNALISPSSGDHTPTELLSEVRGQLLYKNMAVMLTAMLTHH